MTTNKYMLGQLLLLVSGLTLAAWSSHACLDQAALNKLDKQELQTLEQRIPPAFSDTVADGMINSQLRLLSSTPCRVHWELTLPAADITEAQQLLAQEPARQIMLAAQGYQLPDNPLQVAEFDVDASRLQPAASDVLQTGSLGQLRANVELMYAMLTQSRVDPKNGQASVVWSEDARQHAVHTCQQQSKSPTKSFCECWVHALSSQISPKQLRYYQYLSSNPYAYASGHGARLKVLDKVAQQSCSG